VSPRLTREQRAEVHYADRGQWLHVELKARGMSCFGIASLSDPQHVYLCDGYSCTCPDFRFHGLASVRIGQAGTHQPCSHVMAVQRVLEAIPFMSDEAAVDRAAEMTA